MSHGRSEGRFDPPDEELSRLLGEALRTGLDEPVDVSGLVDGARRGATRIRRRRTRLAAAGALLVVAAVPIGVLGYRAGQPPQDAAASAPSSAASAGSLVAGDSSGIRANRAEPPGPNEPNEPSGQAPAAAGSTPVVIPDDALLAPGDLPAAGLIATSDTANRAVAPVAPTAATCGVRTPAPAAAAGSRSISYRQTPSDPTGGWQLISTVRVATVPDAAGYLAAVRALPCRISTPAAGQEAVVLSGPADAGGARPVFAVVRVGGTISELTLTAPATDSSQALGSAERLLRVAADRLTRSGLATVVDGDPGPAR